MPEKISNDNLVKILGIESLPDDQKLRILDQSADLIMQRSLLRLRKTLDDTKQNQLNTVLEMGDPVAISAFIDEVSPDFIKWMEEVSVQLKEELNSLGTEDI